MLAARHPEPTPSLPLMEWTAEYIPSVLTDPTSTFHRWLFEALDGLDPAARLVTQAPRGFGKSTIVSFAYPLREALEGRQRFVVLLSDTDRQAKRFLRAIRREVESNEALKRAYPVACRPGELWREGWLSLGNGCEITALGAGGKIRGLKSVENRRPTLVIADDIQRKEHIHSRDQREKTLEWLNKDVMAAGEPDTRFFVVGTPMHREDIVCTLERTAGWRSRRWKAVQAWPTRLDLWREFEGWLHSYDIADDEDGAKRTARAVAFFEANRQAMSEGAELLWDSRFPLVRLMLDRASMGHAAFESEYQSNPVDPAACEWPEEYLNHPNLYFDQWPDQLVVKTIALDPSKGKDAKQGDYSAIVKFGRDRFGVEYVEADLARRSVDVQCHDLARHCQEFSPHGVVIETSAFQELMVEPIKKAARLLGVDIPTYSRDQVVPKVVRIRQLTTAIAEKRVRFKSRSPGTQLLLQQLRDFPNGSHDDGPDSMREARQLAIDLTNPKARTQPLRLSPL